ncbi:hypothetical protein HPB50_022370 [Hyalomma asiaticum]|uniref:Uncharacterized protein n=1 Tax=Hyalomma asiaticum TaxID=266040 RepID=A0ACB7S272_HYAAI|nr:hypothetical protein HPB50_022370 [Hyalomma asiaticum]
MWLAASVALAYGEKRAAVGDASAAMHQAKSPLGKRGSNEAAKMYSSAPELCSRGAASSRHSITAIPSSSHSMPDLTRAGAVPWWGDPMMAMMMQRPGFAPGYPQPPLTMMPSYASGIGAALQQVASAGILSQPSGSQASFIPYPIPIPLPMQIPGVGGGGGGGSGVTIITGGPPAAPQPLYPYPYGSPYHYPPLEQQPQGNAMAEAAAMMMMMQQMRSMMSRRDSSRRRRPKSRDAEPDSQVPTPPLSVDTTAGGKDTKLAAKAKSDSVGSQAKKGITTAEEDKGSKKSVVKPEEDKGRKDADRSVQDGEISEVLKRDKAGGKEAEGKADGGSEQAQKDASANKAAGASGSAPKTQEGTQETPGKGPDTNAPSLSLNFPSTTALGHHMESTEEETEARRPFNYIGVCCYALFVGFLLCLVVMAIAPTILWTLLELLGVLKPESKEKPADIEKDNITSHFHTFESDVVATRAPFVDIAETFGEIGVDDDLQDGAFAALDAERNYTDSVFDWLLILGNQSSSPSSPPPTMNDRFPQPQRERRTVQNRTWWRRSHVTKTYSRPYLSPLDLGAVNDGNAQSLPKGNNESVGGDQSVNTADTVESSRGGSSPASHASQDAGGSVVPPSTESAASTKSAIRELMDNLLQGRSKASKRPSTLWPLQDMFPFLPSTVYFEWFPTEQTRTTVARRRRSRRRGIGVTLSFQLPEVPTPDIGKIVFYKVFRDFGDEETTSA